MSLLAARLNILFLPQRAIRPRHSHHRRRGIAECRKVLAYRGYIWDYLASCFWNLHSVGSVSPIRFPLQTLCAHRCPTECQLSRSSEPWQCVVSLRLVTDADGSVLPQPRRIDFGDPIFEKSLVTERIRRAQCAILNPGTPYHHFLEPSSDALEKRELSFSSNSICLEICGRDVDDLSFVDLPGGQYECRDLEKV